MFDFIKKLFEKEEEKIEIRENDLEEWIDARISDVRKETDQKIKEIKHDMEEQRGKAKENIKKLKEAALHNPDIPIREQHFMQGNREAYVKRMKFFIENIKVDSQDYNILLQTCNDFNNDINLLGRSTLKEYAVLQHFFANESRDIALNLKEFEKLMNSIRTVILNSGYFDLIKEKEEIDRYYKIKSQKSALSSNLNKLKDNLKEKENEKSFVSSDIESLEKSSDFKRLGSLEERYESLNKKIRSEESDIINAFSPISSALKKYARVSDKEEIIDMYVDNAAKAVKEDKDLMILSVLDSLGRSMMSISLKDKKRDKTISSISKIDEIYLRTWLRNMDTLLEEKDSLGKEIHSSEIGRKIDALRKRQIELDSQISSVERDIHSCKKDLGKIDEKKYLDNIQKSLGNCLKKNIVIIG